MGWTRVAARAAVRSRARLGRVGPAGPVRDRPPCPAGSNRAGPTRAGRSVAFPPPARAHTHRARTLTPRSSPSPAPSFLPNPPPPFQVAIPSPRCPKAPPASPTQWRSGSSHARSSGRSGVAAPPGPAPGPGPVQIRAQSDNRRPAGAGPARTIPVVGHPVARVGGRPPGLATGGAERERLRMGPPAGVALAACLATAIRALTTIGHLTTSPAFLPLTTIDPLLLTTIVPLLFAFRALFAL